MVPDAGTIARRRHLLRTILRCVALGLFIVFLAPVAVMTILALIGGQLLSEVFLMRLLQNAGWLLAAAGLLYFEKRLLAWLVPLGSSRCPQCEYFLVSLVEPRCPECGLPLGAEYLELPDNGRPDRPPTAAQTAAAAAGRPGTPSRR